jgi:hypothetical protein
MFFIFNSKASIFAGTDSQAYRKFSLNIFMTFAVFLGSSEEGVDKNCTHLAFLAVAAAVLTPAAMLAFAATLAELSNMPSLSYRVFRAAFPPISKKVSF